ncbi:hypothetical protein [Nesterenkonia muleiensis]|uniref:hypothetical protein n=1 Tax=Nesterenkonia muleiensis TaxID=2282648 RepID=UPI001300A650|nr:hypothetical protein [Nesterenkonia muleiensis]
MRISRYWSRASRSVAVVLTCLLLGVTMIAASQISEQSSAAVGVAVDENWRGHYDLLVTAPGGLTEAAEETDELIEQNFSALVADESITASQLEAVSALEQVEVAAPLAFIGQFANPAYEAPVGVGIGDWSHDDFFAYPRAFEGTITVSYDDGMGMSQLAQHPDGHFMITGIAAEEVVFVDTGAESDSPEALSEGTFEHPSMHVIDVPESERCECLALVDTDLDLQGFDLPEDEIRPQTIIPLEPEMGPEDAQNRAEEGSAAVYATYEVVPELHSNMVAVDPEAERALLGEDGSFYDALIEFETLQQWAEPGPCEGEPDDDRPVGECLADLIDGEQYPQIHQLAFEGNPRTNPSTGVTDFAPIIPIVYSETEYPEMTAEASFPELATFEDLDYEEATSFEFYQEVLQGERPESPATQNVDVTDHLVPFVYEFDVAFGLGEYPPPDVPSTAEAAQTSSTLPGRAVRSTPDPELLSGAPEGIETALINEPQGRYFLDADMTSSEQRYRPWNISYDISAPEGALLTPVGSYAPGFAGAAEDASYVPLGMYADAEAEIVEPGQNQGAPLPPSFSGRGAVLTSPGVITTMNGYEQYRGEIAADVIRVRVAGIDGYSPQSLSHIEDVAGQIMDLGLDVQVVAGSSLAPVAVYLPEFHEDESDLGWVVEEWTSLGAAVQVEEAQMTASWMLLVIALAGVTLLACAVYFSGIKPRRREAMMLISLGWTRSRVRRWFLAEDIPVLLVVGAAAASAIAISTSQTAQIAAAAATLALVFTVLSGLVMVTAPGSQTRSRAQGSAQPAGGPATIGRRLAWSSPGAVVMTALALLVLSTTAVTFALVILTARSEAGVSRIAGIVNAEVLLPQTVLTVGAITAGVVMFTMAIRQTLRQAQKQHRMLLTTGWALTALATSIRAQLLTSLAPGAILALVAGAGALMMIGPSSPALLVTVVLGVPALAIAVVLGWTRQYTWAQRSP